MNLRKLWRGWRERQTVAAVATAPAASADATAAADLLRLGALQRQRAQYEEAARTLMRAIELKHDLGEAHHNLGLVYLEQGHFEDAADCFELATHFAPRLAAAHLDLGALQVLREAVPEASHGLRPGLLALLHPVELVLHAGRELDVDDVGKRLDEEVGHEEPELGRPQAPLLVLDHVFLVEDRPHDARVRRGPWGRQGSYPPSRYSILAATHPEPSS